MKELTLEVTADNLTLKDLCERCLVDAETVIRLVDYGIAEPVSGKLVAEWRFSAAGYLRIRKALRLQRDLAINAAGVALAIDLLDELQMAQRELDCLRRQLAQDPAQGAGDGEH